MRSLEELTLALLKTTLSPCVATGPIEATGSTDSVATHWVGSVGCAAGTCTRVVGCLVQQSMEKIDRMCTPLHLFCVMMCHAFVSDCTSLCGCVACTCI